MENEPVKLTEKMEYDAAIGGNVQLQQDVITFRYAHNHLDEIKALTSAVENPNSTKLVFQKLPKHMRRRAMSHNPNRLPRKYRLAHIAQMQKSGKPAPSKRPSRKYRRKANNLLLEYRRRQRKNVWLETHIWHAKRFHMIERWGYKLARSSCDKTFRSCYRASSRHCLLQDISYVGCIELIGPLEALCDGLDTMRDARNGLGICARAFVGGKREGTIDLYRRNCYPHGALGRTQFIWQRAQEHSDTRRLWLFVHPSIYRDVVDELAAVFALQKVQADAAQPVQYSSADTRIELVELKDRLNRFRLTGPLSHAVLQSALKIKGADGATDKDWFTDYLAEGQQAEFHRSQQEYWASASAINSPAELIPNLVLALNVEDPRVNRPKRRTKAVSKETVAGECCDAALTIPEYNGDSAIWSGELRSRITDEKVSTHEICVHRNKTVLVPGERCEFETKLQPMPVLLIQRPGSNNPQRLGFGCGWDVIVPPGYGLSTWMCLIMWGARPGALRETETIFRESLEDEFLPDTMTATANDELQAEQLRAK